MWGAVTELLEKAKQLNEKDAWEFAIDVEAKDEIIRLNTQEQLYDEGIDSNENSLGEYSPVTKMIKTGLGQRIDHVTLKDTGAFYRSFRVIVKRDSFEIWADDVSLYDRPLTEVYGIDILGLTPDNLSWLGDFILTKYREYIESKLLQ
jgi:replicative superfamily II helicase